MNSRPSVWHSTRLLRELPVRCRRSVEGLPPVFWALWWGALVNRLASFIAPFLALYLVQNRGLDAATAGQVVALYGAGATLAAPAGGLLADRVGRRATMLGSLVLGAFSVGAIAFTTSPALLAVLAFLAALTGESYRPAMAAAVTDLVPAADRARAFGLMYWIMNLSFGLGMIIAAVTAARGLVALFVADAATTLVFAALIAARVPETRPAGATHRSALGGLVQVFTDGPFLLFLLLTFAVLVVFGQWQLAMPLDMATRGVGAGGFSFLIALNCVGVVLFQPILTSSLKGVDSGRQLAASALLVGLGFGLNALAHGLGLYAGGVALWTAGEMIGFPVASALVASFAPAALRGSYQGAFSMVGGLALMAAPLLGGQVMTRAGGATLWTLCGVLGVLVAAGHLGAAALWRRRIAGGDGEQPAGLERSSES